MSQHSLVRASLVAAVLLSVAGNARAHGVVGRRMFIEPLGTEDANVKNELALPRIDLLHLPDGTTRSIDLSLEKELYAHRLSIIVEGGRIRRTAPAASGWDNIELGLKWEAWTNDSHELAVSPALFAVLPTGSPRVTAAETAVRPMVAAAKGFGDLGVAWLRPFALQADVGYEHSITGSGGQVVYDAVLMYSVPYLNHWVRRANAGRETEETLRTGLSWGSLWGNVFPFVEFNGRRPIGVSEDDTSSLVRAGACWMGKYVQVSIAADINLAPAAGARRGGMTVLADWFIDEIFPALGRTPFGRRGRE